MGILERMFQSKSKESATSQEDQEAAAKEQIVEKQEEKTDQIEQCLDKYQKWLDSDYVDSLDNARSINTTQEEIDAKYLSRLKFKGANEEQIRRAAEAVAIERAKEFMHKKGEPEILLQHFTRVKQKLDREIEKANQEMQNFSNSEIEKYNKLEKEIDELKAMVIAQETELKYIGSQKTHRAKDLEGGISNKRIKIMRGEEELKKLPYALQLQEYKILKEIKEEFDNVSFLGYL